MVRRLLAFSAVACLSGTLAAADWPTWRGPNRDGISTETGISGPWPAEGPKLAWKITDAAVIGVGYGSPAVVGDRIYLVGADGPKKDAKESASCLSAVDGKQIWKTPLDTTPGNFNDGWGGGPRSTPTVDGDHVYVLGSTGDLVCLTTKDGKEVWKKNLVKDFGGKIPTWGYSESVLVDGPNVVVTPGSKSGVVALDKKTGATVWTCEDLKDGAGYSSLVPVEIGGVRQYVSQTMKHGFGVRAKDGKLLWSVGEIGRATAVIPTPVVHDGIAFFTSGYGAGCEAFKLEPDGDGTKATKIYSKNKVVANHHGGVIRFGDNIYGHSDSTGWVCFDYKTGPADPTWSSKKNSKGSIAYADGQFYTYGESKGDLVRIKATPEGWEETGRFTIPATSTIRPKQGKVWAHPVIANGKLYLRDYELLYCYDLPKSGA